MKDHVLFTRGFGALGALGSNELFSDEKSRKESFGGDRAITDFGKSFSKSESLPCYLYRILEASQKVPHTQVITGQRITVGNPEGRDYFNKTTRMRSECILSQLKDPSKIPSLLKVSFNLTESPRKIHV